MESWQIIAGAVTGVITLLLAVYVSFTARGKGPILTRAWRALSPEEKARTDKAPEYRLLTGVFGLLALAFASLTVHWFTLWKLPYTITWGAMVAAMLYALYDSARRNRG